MLTRIWQESQSRKWLWKLAASRGTLFYHGSLWHNSNKKITSCAQRTSILKQSNAFAIKVNWRSYQRSTWLAYKIAHIGSCLRSTTWGPLKRIQSPTNSNAILRLLKPMKTKFQFLMWAYLKKWTVKRDWTSQRIRQDFSRWASLKKSKYPSQLVAHRVLLCW